jgi:hypothetical protein
MGAPIPMPAWRTRTRKIECVLLVAILGMFVQGFGHAETTGADAVMGGRQAAAAHAARAKPHAKPAPPSPNSRGAANVGGASGIGASGNTVGRRASGAAVIGGPARYDAKRSAVIGGTVTARKR